MRRGYTAIAVLYVRSQARQAVKQSSDIKHIKHVDALKLQ